ncbi:hypothetical protein KBI33_02985 [Candidatus Shapirobacteria bacterium]|nr:hypothetical protein [Candidatus Shapirobacteria bacterium]
MAESKEREEMSIFCEGERRGYHGLIRDNKDGLISKISIYKNGHFPDFLYREFLVLVYIKDLNISSAPFGYFTQHLGVDELVMEFITGEHFGDLSAKINAFLYPV